MRKENKITYHTSLSQETCQRWVAWSCWGVLCDRWFSPISVQDMMTIHPFHPWKALRRRWQWKNEQRLLLKTDWVSKGRGFPRTKTRGRKWPCTNVRAFQITGSTVYLKKKKSGIMWQRTSRIMSMAKRILNYLRNRRSFSEHFCNFIQPG